MHAQSKTKQRSIRSRLTLIIVGISMFTLILAAGLFTWLQFSEQKSVLAENLTAIAMITGDNVQAAIVFDNPTDASQILSELNNDPRIIAAAIYTDSNELFASYYQKQKTTPILRPLEFDGYQFDSQYLHLIYSIQIEEDDSTIGSIYIQASLDALYLQLQRNLLITSVIVFLSLIFCVILASRLQKIISNPILELSAATDEIKKTQDFSIRVEHDDYLEIEHLCDGFNRMLDHIEHKDSLLRENMDNLEVHVKERTEELEVANIELKEATEIAENANKAKSQFLASMSHELRTPLNAIIGFTELMQGQFDMEPSIKNYINIINQSGDHLLTLINDILDTAKIEAGKLELQESNIDLKNLLDSIIVMLTLRAHTKGLKLSAEYDSQLPEYICIDSLKLRQILINLIGNAIKFTETGEIKLNVSFLPDEKDARMGELLLRISDTGSGVDADELKDLFLPFSQTKSGRKQHGTGLGLDLSKSYTELMGGNINVESTVGVGTCFSVTLLTLIVNSCEVIENETDQTPTYIMMKPAQKNYKILVVEDVEFNRTLMTSLMMKVGLSVKSVTNGLEAVDCFSKWQPDFIWMDILMPVMSGTQALKKIRALPGGDNVKIVAVTASGPREERTSLISSGFDDVLFKPFREKNIYNSLARFLSVEFIYEYKDSVTSVPVNEINSKDLDEVYTRDR